MTGLILTLTRIRPVYPHFRFVRGSKLFLDMSKVYQGSICLRNHNPCWRYVNGGACVECMRARVIPVPNGLCELCKIPIIKSQANGGRSRKYCDNCGPLFDQQRRKDASRLRHTGFTPEMYVECWIIQDGKCGLCQIDLNAIPTTKRHADHEPESDPKKPRGLLCEYCNTRWLGTLEAYERQGDCKITNPQLLEWQTNPPMSKSSFAIELGWKPALTDKEN